MLTDRLQDLTNMEFKSTSTGHNIVALSRLLFKSCIVASWLPFKWCDQRNTIVPSTRRTTQLCKLRFVFVSLCSLAMFCQVKNTWKLADFITRCVSLAIICGLLACSSDIYLCTFKYKEIVLTFQAFARFEERHANCKISYSITKLYFECITKIVFFVIIF